MNKKTAKPAKRLPTNKELGIKSTRKQRDVAAAMVASAMVEQLELPLRGAKAKARLQGRVLPAAKPFGYPEPSEKALPKRDIRAYEALATTIDKGGRKMQLLWRNAFAATYEVTVCESVGFETFMRVFAEAASGEIKGVKFTTPAREVFPSDRVFGATAWADMSLERARTRYTEATELAAQRFIEKQSQQAEKD